MQNTDKFDEWAILELFGRQRFAGRVSEAMIAGAAFIRLDVPEIRDQAGQVEMGAYTRFFGPTSVYAISPVSEEVARSVAIMCHPQPVQRWELQEGAISLGTGVTAVKGSQAEDPDEELPF